MDSVKKTIKLYWHAAWKHHWWMLLHMSMVSVAAISGGIVLPFITSRGINALPSYLSQGGDFWTKFGIYITGFITFSLVSWIAWRLSGLAIVKFEISVMRDLYRQTFRHLMSMSYRFFTDTFSGSLVAQTNRFVSGFEKIYDVFSFDLLILIIRYVLATTIIFKFAPNVALGLIGWSVIYVFSAVFLTYKKLPLSKKAAANQSLNTARLADNLTNVTNIKYFAREKFEIRGFKKVTENLAKAQTWDWGVGEVVFAWQGLLSVAFEIAVFWMSLSLVASHRIDLGQLVLIQLYISNVISSLWNVPKIVRRFELTFADAAEMSEILYTKPDVNDVANPKKCQIKSGRIDFNNVVFDHKGRTANEALFNNLSLTVMPGEKVGLVGPSGGGKTTLTKLILRMTDISDGTITIDGLDIAQLRQSDLRDCITYVPQEPILFHRSLLENISYGKPDASEAEIFAAAKSAHADEFIEDLPEKYKTLVGERGIKLSGGQRQRVAIARAMLKDAPILLLDEATSALDSASEKLIQDALWKLMQNRTAIVVAHRLSTIQRLDRIIVLDKGEVVEEGTHQELIEKNGLYATLWGHQSGGFLK